MWGRWGEHESTTGSDTPEESCSGGKKKKTPVSGKSLKAAGAQRAKKTRRAEEREDARDTSEIEKQEKNVKQDYKVGKPQETIKKASRREKEGMRKERERISAVRKAKKKEIEDEKKEEQKKHGRRELRMQQEITLWTTRKTGVKKGVG